jgi:hypothetical protein
MWLNLTKNVSLDPSQRLQHVGTKCLDQQSMKRKDIFGLVATNNPPKC